jgi:uncharacterized Zn-binding protein involved in type VI secretion
MAATNKPVLDGDSLSSAGSNSTPAGTFTTGNVKINGTAVAIDTIAVVTTGGTVPCGMATPSAGSGDIPAGGGSNVSIGGKAIVIDGDMVSITENGQNVGSLPPPTIPCTATNIVSVTASSANVKIS